MGFMSLVKGERSLKLAYLIRILHAEAFRDLPYSFCLILEPAVAIIQSHVFAILRTLYSREVN